MCVGVSRAEPKTHSTIVATLVVAPSGKGPLLVPTEIQTATSTELVVTPTVTPTSTATLPPGDESSSTTATPTTPTNLASTTPTADTSAAASEDQPKFSSAQIAGITLGCAAVVVFGILLVLLARCIRKKRFGDLESGSGFSRMRDSMSLGRSGRTGSAPPGFEISSPLPRVQVTRNPADPRWQPSTQSNTPSMRQGGVGLAISPFTARGGVLARPSPALASVLAASRPPTPPSKPTPVSATPVPAPAPAAPSPAQRSQKSLPKFILGAAPGPRAPVAGRSPPKPTLTLAIPKEPEQPVRVPSDTRDSVVTEFAEDGEGDVAPGTAIWRPPTSDPLSATTFYFADKGGNWILRNASKRDPGPEAPKGASGPPRPAAQEAPVARAEVELPSPDHKTRAERAKDAYGGFSPEALVSPLRLPGKSGNRRLGSPIAFQDRRREPQLTSPSLSARLSQTAETVISESSQTRDQPTNAYFTMMRESRDLTGGGNKRRSAPKRASRRISQGSATSIESGIDEDEPQADLSPVAESPQTPISLGKSPVKYPRIRRQSDRSQMSAPPRGVAESDLLPPAHRYNVWHPAGQPSPHGAGSVPNSKAGTPAMPQSNNRPVKPWNAPNLKPTNTAHRNPGQLRTGSPEMRAGPAPPVAETQYWQRQRQIANPASYWNQSQPQPARGRQQTQQYHYHQQQHPQQQPPPPTPPYELPGENSTAPSRRYGTPQQQQQQPQPRPRPGQQLPTPAATPQPQAQPRTQPTPRQYPQQQQQQQQQQPQPYQRPQPYQQPQQQAQRTSEASSQGSQLLAKRRGADKAAALTLAGTVKGDKDGGRGSQARQGPRKGKGWTREREREQQHQQQQQRQHAGGDEGGEGGYGPPVPITPGWLPELTPTRRGEDLYLNVR